LRRSTILALFDANAADGLAGLSASVVDVSYAPGPGASSVSRARMPMSVRRTLVPKPPVPARDDLLNDLLADAAIEPTACELYAPGAGVSFVTLSDDSRSDLEAKPEDGTLLASLALANAPPST